MNESDLILRCRDGDRQAQKELYDRTAARIYGLLLRMTGNEHDALDLAQDTYVRAFERIEQFDERSTFATWLYRIAVNEALQFLKAAARRAEKTGSLVPRAGYGTEEHQTDLRMDLHEALCRLSPDESAILLLRYHEGLDYRQLAKVLGCAAGTVGSRLHRARAQLAGILAKNQRISEER